jgi:hypothetical protein
MAGDSTLSDGERSPWVTALILGSVATPAAAILAVPAPAPIDARFAWPLVVMDRWVVSRGRELEAGASSYRWRYRELGRTPGKSAPPV